ncbi:hypothetical protein, partial [Acidaminobacter sp.]|uniref:hypothetical protein n=1 Tax=Acidaminobacter sp. TaxID=1872102 RepID=UPI002560D33E
SGAVRMTPREFRFELERVRQAIQERLPKQVKTGDSIEAQLSGNSIVERNEIRGIVAIMRVWAETNFFKMYLVRRTKLKKLFLMKLNDCKLFKIV